MFLFCVLKQPRYQASASVIKRAPLQEKQLQQQLPEAPASSVKFGTARVQAFQGWGIRAMIPGLTRWTFVKIVDWEACCVSMIGSPRKKPLSSEEKCTLQRELRPLETLSALEAFAATCFEEQCNNVLSQAENLLPFTACREEVTRIWQRLIPIEIIESSITC